MEATKVDAIQDLFPADAVFSLNTPPDSSTERYHYRREVWPPGPWDTEPFDRVVWTDPSTGSIHGSSYSMDESYKDAKYVLREVSNLAKQLATVKEK